MSNPKRTLMLLFFWIALLATTACAGNVPASKEYKVLSPISSGRLTIYPVIAANRYDASAFMTLDEGMRSGTVIITEAGRLGGLIRRPQQNGQSNAEVNRLMLVNNSNRPLLLLAGEVVTGGKQDRVIGVDRIVPAHSDPVDLSVFCVEPGRWVEQTAQFGSMKMQMAQPSVRRPAMAEKNQQQVWDRVRANSATMTAEVAAAAPQVARELGQTSSYARVMQNPEVQKKVEEMAAPVADYSSTLQKLRTQNAVGVVVAINGQVVWADIFGSPALLESYWPKLVRSYAAEAVTSPTVQGKATQETAQAFVDDMGGRREVAETEPGVYRRVEVTGEGYKVFKIMSLLSKAEIPVHVAKMTTEDLVSGRFERPIRVR